LADGLKAAAAEADAWGEQVSGIEETAEGLMKLTGQQRRHIKAGGEPIWTLPNSHLATKKQGSREG